MKRIITATAFAAISSTLYAGAASAEAPPCKTSTGAINKYVCTTGYQAPHRSEQKSKAGKVRLNTAKKTGRKVRVRTRK